MFYVSYFLFILHHLSMNNGFYVMASNIMQQTLNSLAANYFAKVLVLFNLLTKSQSEKQHQPSSLLALILSLAFTSARLLTQYMHTSQETSSWAPSYWCSVFVPSLTGGICRYRLVGGMVGVSVLLVVYFD